jgi:ribonucleoside-triphosphate reductase
MNLPRLAYESNRDETYFRAKLAILIQMCITALSTRKKIIQDRLKAGLLPGISANPTLNSLEEIPITINLVGLYEAISALVADRASAPLRREIERKVLETAAKVAIERGEKIRESCHVSMIEVPGVERLAVLDQERYGRHVFALSTSGRTSYSQGALIGSQILTDVDYLDQLKWYQSAIDGGCSVGLDLGDQAESVEISNIVQSLPQKLAYVKIKRYSTICRKCGSRIYLEGGRCKNCKSASSIKLIAV